MAVVFFEQPKQEPFLFASLSLSFDSGDARGSCEGADRCTQQQVSSGGAHCVVLARKRKKKKLFSLSF
jgi:hypothetical protein